MTVIGASIGHEDTDRADVVGLEAFGHGQIVAQFGRQANGSEAMGLSEDETSNVGWSPGSPDWDRSLGW